jgi:hypothetical protein
MIIYILCILAFLIVVFMFSEIIAGLVNAIIIILVVGFALVLLFLVVGSLDIIINFFTTNNKKRDDKFLAHSKQTNRSIMGTLTYSFIKNFRVELDYKYEGEWKDSEHVAHQKIFTYNSDTYSKNGDVKVKYEGEVKDTNIMHGKGTITINIYDLDIGEDCFKYVGEWKDGKHHGQGTWTQDGWNIQEMTGNWKDDKLHGQGTFIHDGEKYIGRFKDGKRNGQFNVIHEDGKKIVEQWEDDCYIDKDDDDDDLYKLFYGNY